VSHGCWHGGERYRITTTGHHGARKTARVKTYEEIALEFEFHPETKCADMNGKPCAKSTTGLLQRRSVQIDQIKYIGKESNSLEDVESGLVHTEKSVYSEYLDPSRDKLDDKDSASVEETETESPGRSVRKETVPARTH